MNRIAVRSPLVLVALAASAVLGTSASGAAQSPAPTPTHVMHLVRLANGDYTVPMSDLTDPSWKGSVSLHPAGLKTIVTVHVSNRMLRHYALELHPGKDCNSFGAGNAVALNPSDAGSPSRTIVALPITNLTSRDYVVAARSATNAQQYRESCAKL